MKNQSSDLYMLDDHEVYQILGLIKQLHECIAEILNSNKLLSKDLDSNTF